MSKEVDGIVIECGGLLVVLGLDSRLRLEKKVM